LFDLAAQGGIVSHLDARRTDAQHNHQAIVVHGASAYTSRGRCGNAGVGKE